MLENWVLYLYICLIVVTLLLCQVLFQYKAPDLKLEQYFLIKEYFWKGLCYRSVYCAHIRLNSTVIESKWFI